MPIPGVTAAQYKSGRAPSYLLIWTDKRGNTQTLLEGKAFIAPADAFRAAQDETWRRSLERRDEAFDTAQRGHRVGVPDGDRRHQVSGLATPIDTPRGFAVTPGQDDPDHGSEAPGAGQVAGAAFRQGNMVAAAASAQADPDDPEERLSHIRK